MANRTICLYGKTGTYKTANIGFLSRYVYKKTGKPLRLVSADGGGWATVQKYIDAGFIIPYSIREETNPLFVLHKLIQGYWPVDLHKGKRLTSIYSKSTIDEVGAYAFEGVTSISEMLLDHLAGKKLGMNPAYSFKLTATGEELISTSKGDIDSKKFNIGEKLVDETGKELSEEVAGQYSQDHYGFVQNKMIPFIVDSWALPVEVVIWTGHEAAGEDELERTQIRGVALVGKKGTPKIGRNVGMMIHAGQVTVKVLVASVEDKNKTVAVDSIETRYYFTPHPDVVTPKVVWEAKPRSDSEIIPELLKKYPGGYFVPGTSVGLDGFLEFEDSVLGEGVKELLKLKEEIDKGFKAKGEEEEYIKANEAELSKGE